ncbi:MAG: glycosyltransferase family 2 protein [Patescibacteria group bacterium]
MASVTPLTSELSIVILCYRAGDAVRDFISRTIVILAEGGIPDYELVLVGNFMEGSGDRTPRIVAELAATYPKVVYLAEPKQGMMGWDMRKGLEKARGAYLAVIDGDGQMPIADLVKVYTKIKNERLDMVKTYRLQRGDSILRKTISFIYNLFFHALFPGLNVRDINAKPKIFTRAVYERMWLESNDWFIDAEIMIEARRLHLRIGEIPTVFLGLTGRRSFVKMRAINEFLINLIRYRIREFRRTK